MKKTELRDLYWLQSGSGRFHIGEDGDSASDYEYSGKYVSLCRIVRKQKTGLEEPLGFEGLDSRPEKGNICNKCRQIYEEKWQGVTRVASLRLPVRDMVDLYSMLNSGELSEEMEGRLLEKVEDSLPDQLDV